MSPRPANPIARFRRTIAVLSFGCASLVALSGRADAPDPTRARQLFDDGKAAAARQDWDSALDLFKQSWDASPSYDTAANLGQSALKLGRNDVAARFLSYSLRHFPPSGDAGKRKAVEALYAQASKETSKVVLSTEPQAASLALDGMSVGSVASLEGELFVLPGTHTIEARASGYATERQSIVAQKGKDLTIALKLHSSDSAAARAVSTPAPPESAARPSEPARGSSQTPPAARMSTPPDHDSLTQHSPNPAPIIIESGIFAAALAVGIGFRLSSDGDLKDARALETKLGGNASCSGPQAPAQCADLPGLYDSVNTQRDVSTGAFVVAGIALVAGAGTAAYLYWPSAGGDRAASGAPHARFFNARLEPQIGRSATGISIQGEFE